MPIAKGDPKVPGSGRKKGTKNKITPEVRGLCKRIVTDPGYLDQLTERARTGELPPGIEQMLWAYAHGKPPDFLGDNKDREDFVYTFTIAHPRDRM